MIAAIIGLLFTSSLIIIFIPWMILCATKRKVEPNNNNGGIPKTGYKPGHLPEFADPDQKETNTFYDVNSVIAFPIKDNENNQKASSTTNITTPATDNNHSTTKTPSNVANEKASTPPAPAPPPATKEETAAATKGKTSTNTK